MYPLNIEQVPKDKIRLLTTASIDNNFPVEHVERIPGVIGLPTTSTRTDNVKVLPASAPLSVSPMTTSQFNSPKCSDSAASGLSSPQLHLNMHKSAMRMALAKAIRPSPFSSTKRALTLQKQQRSRVQKKHSKILTREEGLGRFKKEDENHDAKKSKKILKVSQSNKRDKNAPFINRDICVMFAKNQNHRSGKREVTRMKKTLIGLSVIFARGGFILIVLMKV